MLVVVPVLFIPLHPPLHPPLQDPFRTIKGRKAIKTLGRWIDREDSGMLLVCSAQCSIPSHNSDPITKLSARLSQRPR